MEENNKHNILYFESPTMKGLFTAIEKWQIEEEKRLLSISIQEEKGVYCCIALTNPTEVSVTGVVSAVLVRYDSEYGRYENLRVSNRNELIVKAIPATMFE